MQNQFSQTIMIVFWFHYTVKYVNIYWCLMTTFLVTFI